MRWRNTQFSVRWAMIAVALIGLNLGAALATSRYYPRPPQISVGYGGGQGSIWYLSDGSILLGSGNAEFQLEHVVRRLPPLTLLQIWSPVIAAAAVTVLVLILASRSPTPRHRRSRARFLARWAVIALALVGLNLAAAVYSPPWSRDQTYDPIWQSSFRMGEGTMICQPDGSILAYQGAPGEISPGHPPRVVRRAMGSWWRLWSPTIIAATITLLALLIAWRQSHPGQGVRESWERTMSSAWKIRRSIITATLFRPIIITALIAGLALAVAGLATPNADRVWGHLPNAVEASTRSTILKIASPLPKRVPLDCRAVPVGKAEQRAWLAKTWGFEGHPELLPPRILRNPLFADAIQIEVENTSGRDFNVYSWGKDPFWITVLIEDAAGRLVQPPLRASNSLKRLSPVIPGTPLLTLKPGQVVTQRSGIWNYPYNPNFLKKPGKYTVRVVCSYYRTPDGRDCRVEAAPFVVKITKRDIREWREIHEAKSFIPVPHLPGPPPPP